jgi:hypothetical protein
LFQENKSFGVRTICIHPLMQEAVSGTVWLYYGIIGQLIATKQKT